ncbi:MAG: tRNA pseudouridine(55) synthase TruB [Synergistaceae bacterium]|nr:tRNA pseudouridine(55) synthase TruB [Synergistaceae bacterium]
MFQGILAIDKPIGLRSSYCVEQLRKIIGKGVKLGHGGTLDSTASGVLVMLFGGATRLSDLVIRMPKTYRAVLRLGVETSTWDYSGDVTKTSDYKGVTASDIDGRIPSFLGWRMQLPPEVSAVHVKGRRAHEIFRFGQNPEIRPRPVFVEYITRTADISDGKVELLIRCGKGAYVRAIARDFGRILGCGAHIASLRREAVGHFTLKDAFSWPEDISAASCALESMIRPAGDIGRFIPVYTVSGDLASHLSNGRNAPLDPISRISCGHMCPPGIAAVSTDSILSVGRINETAEGLFIRPEINIKLEQSGESPA